MTKRIIWIIVGAVILAGAGVFWLATTNLSSTTTSVDVVTQSVQPVTGSALEKQVKKLQDKIQNLQKSAATKVDLNELAKRVDKAGQGIALASINTEAIIEIQGRLDVCAKAAADNAELVKKVQETASANSATLVVHKKILRDHDSRLTTAQLTGNRAIAALMVACGMTIEEATAKVNAFVTGDLKIKHLAGVVKRIPIRINRAQKVADKAQKTAVDAIATAVINTELLYKHGAKETWLKYNHDGQLAAAAHAVIALRQKR